MTTMASEITSLTVVYSTVYSDADQRKHQSSASLAFVWGIHRDRWIPRTKGQLRGKCFHLMTSSCTDMVRVLSLFISLRLCNANICVSNFTITGSYNDLAPGRHQAIIPTHAGILLTGPLVTNFSEILSKCIGKYRQENGGHFVSVSMYQSDNSEHDDPADNVHHRYIVNCNA